jgi:hypothetical protein
MALNDYSLLPDLMPTADIDNEVQGLLALAPGEDPTGVAEAMFELVLRAGRNEQPLSAKTLGDMDGWFQGAWSAAGDEVLVDIMLSIVVNLPLPGAVARVRATQPDATARNAELLKEALAELGRHAKKG